MYHDAVAVPKNQENQENGLLNKADSVTYRIQIQLPFRHWNKPFLLAHHHSLIVTIIIIIIIIFFFGVFFLFGFHDSVSFSSKREKVLLKSFSLLLQEKSFLFFSSFAHLLFQGIECKKNLQANKIVISVKKRRRIVREHLSVSLRGKIVISDHFSDADFAS